MKRLLIISIFACIFASLLALGVGAQVCADGEHTSAWEIRCDKNVLSEAYSQERCQVCGLVLDEDIIAPIIEDKGFAYYEGNVVQGYRVYSDSISKHEERSGKKIEYGIVAASRDAVGTNPLDSDGVAVSEKVITIDMSAMGSEHFDIKVVSIPDEKMDVKLILCAYIIVDGQVLYVDNGGVDSAVAGISYNEIVELIEDGTEPEGLYEYRQLTLEEMDILTGHYWFSTNLTYGTRLDNGNNFQRYAAPRMFAREELPAGSYIVVEAGWSVRPEMWAVDENGEVLKNKTRPYSSAKSAGTYIIEDLYKDTTNSDGSVVLAQDYRYISFNVSDTTSSDLRQMTAEGISAAFKIFVPCGTKVEKTEIEEAEQISVEGLRLLEWNTENLFANAYWNCTSSTTVTKGNATGKDFFATMKFTEETLPVGSVIEMNGDIMCRLEYWINGAKVSTRGGVSDVHRILVTKEFWDEESEWAFNISRISKAVRLSESDREEIENAFRIYVPVE